MKLSSSYHVCSNTFSYSESHAIFFFFFFLLIVFRFSVFWAFISITFSMIKSLRSCINVVELFSFRWQCRKVPFQPKLLGMRLWGSITKSFTILRNWCIDFIRIRVHLAGRMLLAQWQPWQQWRQVYLRSIFLDVPVLQCLVLDSNSWCRKILL